MFIIFYTHFIQKIIYEMVFLLSYLDKKGRQTILSLSVLTTRPNRRVFKANFGLFLNISTKEKTTLFGRRLRDV